ncbi:MAG: peptide-methionine (S)-S-oxide reductase MsrA [Puniceicoccales bacterium]
MKKLKSLLTSRALLFPLMAVAIALVLNAAEDKTSTQPKAMTQEKPAQLETATLGAGCFWCVEAVFERIDGVHSVMPGYTGGHVKDPTYNEVCAGTTGHAEVAQIEFDPEAVSYSQILDVFFKSHDPTTLNRQGADVGTQYRSAIFYNDDKQKQLAQLAIEKWNAAEAYDNPIVTEVTELGTFYPAENYHQDYYNKNPNAGYCAYVIRPKLKKLGLE